MAAKTPAKKPKSKPATKKPGEPEKDPEEKGSENSSEITLKDMDLSRDEAIQMLKDEKVKFKEDASDAILAAKVKDLLDDDDSK